MSLKLVRTVLVILLVATVVPAHAHGGWSVGGSVEVSVLPGCGNSPTCTRFVFSACDPSIAQAEGVDVSIVPLPPMTGWHRAQISWTAEAGPVGDGVQLDFLGFVPNGCVPFWNESSEADTFDLIGTSGSRSVQIPPETHWLMISATAATGIRWSAVGIED